MWSRWAIPAVLFPIALLLGCSGGARLIQDDGSGGIVTYPFGDQGHLLSSFRRDAMRIMDRRCAGGYRIVREGEVRGQRRVAGLEGAEEVIHQRRWGIEFRCR